MGDNAYRSMNLKVVPNFNQLIYIAPLLCLQVGIWRLEFNHEGNPDKLGRNTILLEKMMQNAPRKAIDSYFIDNFLEG